MLYNLGWNINLYSNASCLNMVNMVSSVCVPVFWLHLLFHDAQFLQLMSSPIRRVCPIILGNLPEKTWKNIFQGFPVGAQQKKQKHLNTSNLPSFNRCKLSTTLNLALPTIACIGRGQTSGGTASSFESSCLRNGAGLDPDSQILDLSEQLGHWPPNANWRPIIGRGINHK